MKKLFISLFLLSLAITSQAYLTPFPTGPGLTFSDSLVNTAGTVTLVGDSPSPTASQYYGTNAGSVLGYYNLPSAGSGVTTIGAIDSQTPSANALFISGVNLYSQSASSSNPGMVNNTTQTFSGSKSLGSVATDKTTIGAASSTAVHQINGGLQVTTNTITTSYTVDSITTDYEIFCNFSVASNVTLPAPTNGRMLFIKDISGTAATNNITIVRHGSENIGGLAANYVLQASYGTVKLISDGTNWWLND